MSKLSLFLLVSFYPSLICMLHGWLILLHAGFTLRELELAEITKRDADEIRLFVVLNVTVKSWYILFVGTETCIKTAEFSIWIIAFRTKYKTDDFICVPLNHHSFASHDWCFYRSILVFTRLKG